MKPVWPGFGSAIIRTVHRILGRGEVIAAVAACSVLLTTASAQAGGGPENVALVVNTQSWASVTIAMHYANIRQIPVSNIVYVDWPYSTERVDSQTFRSAILGVVTNDLAAKRILDQIDYIIYSSDFPTLIDIRADLGRDLGPRVLPLASLTAMTYASPQLGNGNFDFIQRDGQLNLRGNHYGRRATSDSPKITTTAFRSWHGYTQTGKVVEGGGDHYFLSMMLGVTSQYGNSVDEVLSYLRRSARADNTKPKGTIYFCKNPDVRSTTRDALFPEAVAELKKLGVRAEIVSGIMPQAKNDVQGLTTGTRGFDWKASKSTILPGAICDNFTSFGGAMGEHDQTRLTEYLRYGAAGASGTVAEPIAIAEKFPHPFVQVHYARGCTLAESFYQSLYAPYQMLIVGDPLCRPWANIPRVTVEGASAESVLAGPVKLTPQGTVDGGTIDRFELFVDGVRAGACSAGETITFDTTAYPDGAAELRIVGIEAGKIESQGRLIFPVSIDNHSGSIIFSAGEGGGESAVARWRAPIRISARSIGAKKIGIYAAGRQLDVIDGERGSVSVLPEKLGTGPVILQAKARGPDDKTTVVSPPIQLTVESYTPFPGRKAKADAKPMLPGLQFLAEGGSKLIVPRTDGGKWLTETKIGKDQKFTMAAIFRIPADGVYQFQMKHVGPAEIKIDGNSIYAGEQKTPQMRYLPVALGAGLHEFRLTGKGDQPTGLEIRFGGPGAQHLDGKLFQHPG
ncbi:MAG TPA: TIGR03790 family protein [Pirellulales bacterium]